MESNDVILSLEGVGHQLPSGGRMLTILDDIEIDVPYMFPAWELRHILTTNAGEAQPQAMFRPASDYPREKPMAIGATTSGCLMARR